MTLLECFEKIGEREYQTWMAYFEDEWNNPIRSDYYLMQVACQAARVMNTKASQITPEMF